MPYIIDIADRIYVNTPETIEKQGRSHPSLLRSSKCPGMDRGYSRAICRGSSTGSKPYRN